MNVGLMLGEWWLGWSQLLYELLYFAEGARRAAHADLEYRSAYSDLCYFSRCQPPPIGKNKIRDAASEIIRAVSVLTRYHYQRGVTLHAPSPDTIDLKGDSEVSNSRDSATEHKRRLSITSRFPNPDALRLNDR